jgi:hypothetical protein
MTPEQAAICPLCLQNNACDVSNPLGCWCMQKEIPKALIKKAQALQQEPRCICQNCIEQYLNNHH